MSPLERAARFFEGTRRGMPVAAAMFLVAVVGYLDYRTGWEMTLAPFYLIPISLVAWIERRSAAIAFSCFCAVAWIAIDRLAGHVYSSDALEYWNGAMQLGFFLIVALTLSSLRKSYDRERASAGVDALTGIANRRSFDDIVGLEIRRALRYRRPMTLAYLDVDFFKTVNDRFGHAAGDGVLRLVADAIRRNMRSTDTVARMGGDEFLVLFPETDEAEARVVVEKMRGELKATAGEGLAPITLSIGVATFRTPPETVRQMIEKADTLMYLVKRRGKNAVEFGVFDGREAAG